MNIITTNCLRVEESRAVIPWLSAVVPWAMQSAKVKGMLQALATEKINQADSLKLLLTFSSSSSCFQLQSLTVFSSSLRPSDAGCSMDMCFGHWQLSQQQEGDKGLGSIFCCGKFEGEMCIRALAGQSWGFPPMTQWAFFNIYSSCSLHSGMISQEKLEEPSLKSLSPPKPQTGWLWMTIPFSARPPNTHTCFPNLAARVLQTKLPFPAPSHLSSQTGTNAKHEAYELHFHRDENTQRD